jgi:hypothetical protein
MEEAQMSENNIPYIVDQGASWAYQGDPMLKPNTITFSGPATWVMQLTADRKIIVNEDVEVSEAAQVVLDAVQNLLLAQRRPLSDQAIVDCVTAWAKNKYQTIYIPPTDHQVKQTIEMARVIEKAHGIE